ncbi:MAG: ATPase [Anaerophaga sp.]|uniref:ATP-binding protein n=1 Tax=Anaerophaga thermohalophila TaxID=177400 RepID=UPI0002D56869|nr:ATP-binding protein [Anaerophaga thermohalophila]MBZ4677354.1 ATPase [Anaerophaga sp.]MDN5290933.1 uncharacterized protein [Anaerophaga sp.]
MIKVKDYIPRPKYFKQVEPFIGNSLIKIFTGQRRVGKSYILYQVMDEIQKRDKTAKLIYINKEDYEFDDINNYKDLINYVNRNLDKKKNNCLFIDEIQDIEEFEKALRHFQNNDNFDIYCTGSNSKLLSGELSTFLAGRFIQIRIFALSYPEFLSFHQVEDSNDSLLSYIKYGGLPHLINLKKQEEVYYEYLNNVFNSIVLRDIVMRYNIRNVNFLQDLIHFIAENTGSLVSAKRISDYLKSQNINLSTRMVLEYLSHLQSVFFIDRVKRTDVIGKKIFEIGEKYYFEDTGLRHALIPYNQKDIGKILENLIYHHLKYKGFKVYVGKIEDLEIDFVAAKQNEKIYIQAAYLIPDEKTHKREFGNLLKIKDNYTKMVISMDEMASGNFKGIEHWHIRKFLTRF